VRRRPAKRRRAKQGRGRHSRRARGPERHTIEALDSLAVDIARMIDHDAAAELWDRYNRGERNVFTRKLYTMQGQKAFEEIRRKYRSERDFQRTVDRYIGEFERLLEEVSRDDRGQAVARTYLTSETARSTPCSRTPRTVRLTTADDGDQIGRAMARVSIRGAARDSFRSAAAMSV
jgi:hypothetical protein